MQRSALDIKCTSPLPRRGAEAFLSNTWLPKRALGMENYLQDLYQGLRCFLHTLEKPTSNSQKNSL